ncbi:Kinesin-like protein kif24 [Podila verticillata]|nr:Kinesin-like protein kif24 [Podila verticillata]
MGRIAGGANYTPNDMSAKIRVCVRKRPLNSKEINRGEKDMATVAGRQLTVDEPKVRVDMTKFIERHNFVFDEVFDSDATNEDVYKRTAYPLVQYLFEGGKATCFAYGQTGSGKTFTMLDDKQGLYVLAARDIFVMLRKPENSHLGAFIGFYEIYQGHLYDLLNSRKRLHPREDGKSNVVISGLKEYEIVNVQGLMQVFEYGNNVRSTGSTNANADSSRSHAIMQIVLKDRATKSVEGKLSFIDLAGSERGADRGDTDVKTRMEGAEINKSLLALKECIRALDQDKKHTPFRQSKLTQVLKDSFVGNSRTCMVATISPNNSNSEHTLNTLRYADRVKELKAEGGAKGTAPGEDTSLGQEEYMDDDAFEENELTANVYGDEYLSSESENVADVTIDLLEDEEFPDLLDQEEMSHHTLASTTYEHELEDHHSQTPQQQQTPQSHTPQQTPQHHQHVQQQMSSGATELRRLRGSVDQGDSRAHPQSPHRQAPQPEPERQRELSSSSLTKSSTSQLQQQHHAIKNRKSESAFSRLPMPKSFQLQAASSSNLSSSASTTTLPPHRNSLTGGNGRNSTANTSPPLGSGKSGRQDSKTSPDTSMSPGNGSGGDYISHKSSGSNVSPNAKYPSINTKHGHSSSASSSSNNGAPVSATEPNAGFFNHNAAPSSPKSGGNTNNNNDWSPSDMTDLVREHRAQLRDGGELTKRETKLLANVTLGMSSEVHGQSTGYFRNRESFLKYLNELDEIIDKKLISIVSMSEKIKALREQIQ